MTYPNPFPPQWQPPQPPPPPRQPATNVAAIIALTCAVVGLVVLPILLGPVAIVAGMVGEHQARTEGRKLGKAALGGIVIGAVITLIALDRILPL